MSDPTETIRMALTAKINAEQAERQALSDKYGQIWNTQELKNDFEVEGFMAPFVMARRKSDNKPGTLMFQHHPRYYFSFSEA